MGDFKFNENQNRYEKDFDGHIAYANVRKIDNVLYLDYVFAPPELRGTGAAGKLMSDIMAAVKEDGLTAKPICGYAVSWLRRHKSEYGDITI